MKRSLTLIIASACWVLSNGCMVLGGGSSDDTASAFEQSQVDGNGSCFDMGVGGGAEEGKCLQLTGSGFGNASSTLFGPDFCALLAGTYSDTDDCPEAGLVGICHDVDGGENAEYDEYFYSPDFEALTAEVQCTSGEWWPDGIEPDSDTGPEDIPDFFGSCSSMAFGYEGQCYEYLGPAYGDSDSPSYATGTCAHWSGTFSAGECSSTDLVGVCREVDLAGNPEVERDIFFYTPEFDATSAEAECTALDAGASWEPV